MSNRHILLINAIIELFGGILFILYPEFLLMGDRMDNLELNLSKMYGIGASCIGFFSYLLYRFANDGQLIKFSSLTIIAFHLVLCLHLYGMYTAELLNGAHAAITHAILALLFVSIYLKNVK